MCGRFILLSSVLIIAVKSLLDSCSEMEMLMNDGGCLIGVCGDTGCCWSKECRWRFIGVGLLIKDCWEVESSRLLMVSSLCRALSLLIIGGCCCGNWCCVGFC